MIRMLVASLLLTPALCALENGGFEEALASWEATPACVLDAVSAFSGKHSARLSAGGVLSQRLRRTSFDRPVLLVGWFRTDGASGSGPRLELVAETQEGGRTGTPIVAMGDAGTRPWHRVQIVGLLPYDATSLLLEVHGPRAGTAWVDEVRVIEGTRAARQYLLSSVSELIPQGETKRYTCYRAPNEIVCDGDLRDWAQVPAHLAMAVGGGDGHGATSGYGGAADASMLAYVVWDERALYLATILTDDQSAVIHGNQVSGDMVIAVIYVDPVLRTGYDLLCYFPLREAGSTQWRRLPLGRNSAGRTTIAVKDGHIIMEAEIPLTEIVSARDADQAALDPRTTACVRFDVGLYDSDKVRREHHLMWNTRTTMNQPHQLGWFDFVMTRPPFAEGDKAVGQVLPEDHVRPYDPPQPGPRLGPVGKLPSKSELLDGLAPDQQARLRSFTRLYKEHWRPHISLAGVPTPTDRARAQQITQRLLQAYALFDDKEAGALAAETQAALSHP